MVIRVGLCSVTFRALAAADVAALAAESGLESVEWGGDVHVPPGDVVGAEQVAEITANAGLVVASYGSYYRASEGEDIAPVLDSAEALGAQRVRVWAGRVGSDEADAAQRSRVVEHLRTASAAAAQRGLTLSLEYHRQTLADTPDATLRLLDEVGHPALHTYWQPTVGAPDDVAIAEYRAIADRVTAAHVFSWWPHAERQPLDARDALWRGFFAAAGAQAAPPQDALLEFVPDDDPAVLPREAEALRRYRRAATFSTD